MPEGDLIKKLANQWGEFKGEKFTLSSPQGRFKDEARFLTHKTLLKTDTHGKHLFLQFESLTWIHIHLGLYGKFKFYDSSVPEPKDTVRLRAEHAKGAIDLAGPTRCQLITEQDKILVHERLGIDPLRDQDSIKEIREWLENSSWPVGKTLMAQEKIAGLGNIYRAEMLFMLGHNPWTLTKDLSFTQWEAMWSLAQDLLRASVIRGGMIQTTGTDSPRALTVGRTRPTDSRSYVYKRTGLPCYGCNTAVSQAKFDGRVVYWCETCQPMNSRAVSIS